MDRNFAGRKAELAGILPNIRRFALSLTGSLADADDLLQSTVLRLLERGLPDDAELLPWSLKVCRNLWIDELRSRRTRRDAAAGPLAEDDDFFPGEDAAIGSITLDEVRRVLASMPEEQRAVIELIAVEGYAYKEAAEVLDIPIGTVMSRLARARAAIADRQAADEERDE
ncbi:MAG: sigma-70 family RNA polymerase sigma factor [Woeseiaceae bacterium]|nr:sigma-70 family RNA polymerase sigma factor [Woeseiaceae bacterium]